MFKVYHKNTRATQKKTHKCFFHKKTPSKMTDMVLDMPLKHIFRLFPSYATCKLLEV